jgi:hypothetical protein
VRLSSESKKPPSGEQRGAMEGCDTPGVTVGTLNPI